MDQEEILRRCCMAMTLLDYTCRSCLNCSRIARLPVIRDSVYLILREDGRYEHVHGCAWNWDTSILNYFNDSPGCSEKLSFSYYICHERGIYCIYRKASKSEVTEKGLENKTGKQSDNEQTICEEQQAFVAQEQYDSQYPYDAHESHDAHKSYNAQDSYESHETHKSYDAQDSYGAHESHDAKDSYDARESHDAYESYDAQNSYDSHKLHDALESYDTYDKHAQYDAFELYDIHKMYDAYEPLDAHESCNEHNLFDTYEPYDAYESYHEEELCEDVQEPLDVAKGPFDMAKASFDVAKAPYSNAKEPYVDTPEPYDDTQEPYNDVQEAYDAYDPLLGQEAPVEAESYIAHVERESYVEQHHDQQSGNERDAVEEHVIVREFYDENDTNVETEILNYATRRIQEMHNKLNAFRERKGSHLESRNILFDIIARPYGRSKKDIDMIAMIENAIPAGLDITPLNIRVF